MYRIVFSGEVLDDFQKQDVQKAAGIRLRANDAQLARLFSGEPAVLKKAVSLDAAKPYLAELERMGMRARLEPLRSLDEATSVQITFKVVFWGKTLAGYNKGQVMRAVPRRLQVSEQQVERLFSGGKSVLKRHVSAEAGARYVTELARIGMQVELEIETESLPTMTGMLNVNATTGAVTSTAINEEESYGNFMQTQVDLQRGTLIGTNILGVYNGADEAPEAAPVPPPPPTPIQKAVQKVQATERLASAIDVAKAAELAQPRQAAAPVAAEARCPQCGHRQAAGGRKCAACGCALMSKNKSSSRSVMEEMTRSMHDELNGKLNQEDMATLMREMRRSGEYGSSITARRTHTLRMPMLVGGACVLVVGGWLLLGH